LTYLCVFLLGAGLTAAGFFVITKQAEKKNPPIPEKTCNNTIYVGETALSDYVICYKKDAGESAKLLSDYIYRSTGLTLPVVSGKTDNPAINLTVDKEKGTDYNAISIDLGEIQITADSKEDLKKEVEIFANSYLGFSFAGQTREKPLYEDKTIYIPESVYSNPNGPYFEKREATIVLWNPSYARGAYYNHNTLKKSDILTYTDDALYDYVKMMHSFGYSGIQVTDICAAWAEFGGYEFVHERIRFMADAAHSLGMDFTLWVWGAEFNGYGWNDKTVKYATEDGSATYSDPEVYATYEKYYDIYAELADCTDRLIVHFFEPGHVYGMDGVAFWAKMIRDTFREVNPSVDVGINVYSHYFDMEVLHDEMGEDLQDFTYYTLGMYYENDDLTGARTLFRNYDVNYGIWSWGVAEHEIDQIAEMSVNARLIKHVYEKTTALDWIKKPTYWSEMEAYHMANIFSLYVSGALLQNPELDADALLYDAAKAFAGPEHARELYDVLLLIQDARTGDSHETFYESDERFVLVNADYDAKDILKRCKEAINTVNDLINADDLKPTVPLAISAEDVLKIMLPHLEQIKEYAEFKITYDKLVEMAESGMDKETLAAHAQEIFVPVNEYNVVTGLWGLQEQRTQLRLLDAFCEKYDIPKVQNDTVDYYRKQRILGEFISFQQASDKREEFPDTVSAHMSAGFGEETIKRLVSELVEEGLLSRAENGKVYLTDWERYKFNY